LVPLKFFGGFEYLAIGAAANKQVQIGGRKLDALTLVNAPRKSAL
jgi:hypothetical protein